MTGWLDTAWTAVPQMYHLPSGEWLDRNWRNIPGPLYMTRSAVVLREEQPATALVARDQRGHTYLWRQPRDATELVEVLSLWGWWGIPNDELGIDGDAHWTLDTIRAWWSLRDEIGAAYRASGIPDLARYMEHELPEYLRSYAFFLVEGRRPTASDVLPEIDVPPAITIAPPTATFTGALELFHRRRELIEDRGLRVCELPFWGEPGNARLDVPGLFAVSATADAVPGAPGNVCAGPTGAFVYRQPSSPRELERLLEIAVAQPLALRLSHGYGSVPGLRAWWKDHHEAVRAALVAGGVKDADAYVDEELASYVRSLMFLVENGRLPGDGEELPGFVYKRPPPNLTGLVLCDPSELPVAIPPNVFRGRFDEKNRLNIPGMFYGADTDSCDTGPAQAPDNVARDDHGQEFVFSQPNTKHELSGVISAAEVEVFGNYGCDGNMQWTVDLVRAWWAERDVIREGWREAEISDVDERFEADVPQWLRMFMFYLVHRRAPRRGEELPALDG